MRECNWLVLRPNGSLIRFGAKHPIKDFFEAQRLADKRDGSEILYSIGETPSGHMLMLPGAMDDEFMEMVESHRHGAQPPHQ